jgi:hypothetical protein
MITGKLVTATFAAGVVLMLAGCGSSLDPTAEHFTDSRTISAKIDAVRLDSAGAVTIAATDSSTTSIQRTVYYHGDRPGSTVSTSGEQLLLGPCGSECTVDYVIAVPRGSVVTGHNTDGTVSLNGLASVDVGTGTGDVRVADVPGRVQVQSTTGTVVLSSVGPVQVRTSTGSIELSGVSGQVDAEATTGSVIATGLHGPAQLRATTGKVSATEQTAVDLDAEATTGSVTVTVPAGDYRLSVTARLGRTRVADGVHGDPDAAHQLTVRTGTGSATINQG